jgi:guanosine-3',5'-bis(diphosphate) 3'-pyrophosphohydrolase
MGDYTSDMTDQVAGTDPALATVTVPSPDSRGAPPTGPAAEVARSPGRRAPRVARQHGPQPILQSLREHHPKADVALLQRAFEVAERRTRGRPAQRRPLHHPPAVGDPQILADLGLTPPTLAAALLHDTVEDTGLHP